MHGSLALQLSLKRDHTMEINTGKYGKGKASRLHIYKDFSVFL